MVHIGEAEFYREVYGDAFAHDVALVEGVNPSSSCPAQVVPRGRESGQRRRSHGCSELRIDPVADIAPDKQLRKLIYQMNIKLILLVLNLIGIVFYFLLTSLTWTPQGEAGLDSESGEPLIWFFMAFPILLFCFLANLSWLIIAGIRAIKTRHSNILFLPCAAIGSWILVILVDILIHRLLA
jgi:hypothetical protein